MVQLKFVYILYSLCICVSTKKHTFQVSSSFQFAFVLVLHSLCIYFCIYKNLSYIPYMFINKQNFDLYNLWVQNICKSSALYKGLEQAHLRRKSVS